MIDEQYHMAQFADTNRPRPWAFGGDREKRLRLAVLVQEQIRKMPPCPKYPRPIRGKVQVDDRPFHPMCRHTIRLMPDKEEEDAS